MKGVFTSCGCPQKAFRQCIKQQTRTLPWGLLWACYNLCIVWWEWSTTRIAESNSEDCPDFNFALKATSATCNSCNQMKSHHDLQTNNQVTLCSVTFLLTCACWWHLLQSCLANEGQSRCIHFAVGSWLQFICIEFLDSSLLGCSIQLKSWLMLWTIK